MDLLYSISRKYLTKTSVNQGKFHNGGSLCALSSRNVIAFTTSTEIDDNVGTSWGSHVYVCDLNMPWHCHKVTSKKASVTAIKWNWPGEKLALATSTGLVELWTFKDHVINDWILIGSHHFPSENILAIAWFHNGKRISLVNDKKDCMQYNEKFSHLSYAPSVKQFGGRAAEGVFTISNTGMLGAIIITDDKQHPLQCTTESIGNTRQNIAAVDISYAKNGQFLTAVNSGSIISPIRCYRVSIRKINDQFSIISQALPSFFLQDNSSRNCPGKSVVTHLKFMVRETVDSLIVVVSNEHGSYIEVWELSEKCQPVHKLFQAKSLEPFKTVIWQHQTTYKCRQVITAISTTKLTILAPTSHILIACNDSSVRCLNHDGLKEIAVSSLNSNWLQEEHLNKFQRMSTSISCIDISWLGCISILSDTHGNLYVYKLITEGSSLVVNYASTLLEYCLHTGLDWLDLLLCLRLTTIEALIERFDASFNRQLLPVQQYYYRQFLSIKISLYRMLVNFQNKAADLSSLYMIHSIATAFKSLLRPSDLTFHDKVPAERLPQVITENNITDVDKVLLHLEPKEFTVEPITLQSLQQLIQWIADLALNLLVRLPSQRSQVKSSGYELLRDQKALNILRELFVIMRMWGLVRQSCLPVFLRSADNIDVLGLLFHLLSKLVQSLADGQQIDEGLIDECCLLPNQIMIPHLNQANSITAIATPNLLYQSFPLQLEYGCEPDLSFTPELNAVEGCMQSGQVVDNIRHIYLGKSPPLSKQCTRCGTRTQVQNTSRTAAIRAWEQRWAIACLCGGIWRICNSS